MVSFNVSRDIDTSYFKKKTEQLLENDLINKHFSDKPAKLRKNISEKSNVNYYKINARVLQNI